MGILRRKNLERFLKEQIANATTQTYINRKRPLLNLMRKSYVDPSSSQSTLYHYRLRKELRKELRKPDRILTSEMDFERLFCSTLSEKEVIRSIKDAVQHCIPTLIDSLHYDLFQDGSGAFAEVESVSGNTVTFKQYADMKRVVKGMNVNFLEPAMQETTAIGSRPPRIFIITEVNPSTRQVILNDPAKGVFKGYFMFFDRDEKSPACGLKSWIPSVAPTKGGNVELTGHRYKASSGSLRCSVETLALRIKLHSGYTADTLIIHPSMAQKLREELQSQNMNDSFTVNDNINNINIALQLDGFLFPDPSHRIRVIEDDNQDLNLAHLLKMDNWSIRFTNGLAVLDELRDPLNDHSFSARTTYNLICTNPGANGVLVFQ